MDQFFGVVIWGRQGENMGMVLAHEIGHFLGLYHTDVDNISDTKAYNHWIDKDQKPKGSEISNLMHVSVGKKATLSPAQKNILLRAVAVELYEPIK